MTQHDLLMMLLKSEINGTYDISEDIKKQLTTENINNLYCISKSHDLSHIVGKAIHKNSIELPSELNKKFEKAKLVSIYRYISIEDDLSKIYSAFEDAKIPYIPLKGAVIRQYYPEPYMRTSCDIDVFVKDDDIDRSVDVLVSKLGYKLENKFAHDISLFSPNGTHFELHFALTEDDKAEKIFYNIWNTSYLDTNSSCRYLMNNEMFVVYQITHIARHFLEGGCGIRPLMDLWITKNRIGYDEQRVIEKLSECELDTFGMQIILLSNVWFGEEKHSEITMRMQEYIVCSGAYGTINNRVCIEQNKDGGRLKHMKKRVFPSKKYLSIMYPKINKSPMMYPFYLLKRWIKILFTKRTYALEELKHNITVSNTRKNDLLELCTDLKLI